MDDDLHDEALAIAIEAGAVERCFAHNDVWIDQGDPEATSLAYAIATNKWKSGELTCERTDILEAVKNVLVWAADDCSRCQTIMRE